MQAINPTGSGPESAPSNAVTPLDAGRAGRADRRRGAQPPSQSATVSWTAPASDGDSAITGYTVTPYIGVDGADAGPGRRVGDERDGDRADQRHDLHVPVDGDQRRRQRAPRRPPPTPSRPQATIFDFADAGDASTRGDTGAVELGVKFKADTTARSPASASTRRRRTPAPTSAACGRAGGTRLAQATFTGETRLRLADGRRSPPRSPITAGTTYVASYFAPSGHYAATAGGLSYGRRQRAAARARQRDERQRRLRLRRDEHVPDQQLQRDQLLGRRACTRCPAPGQVTGVTATRGRQHVGQRVAGRRRPSGGPVTSYTDHARTSARRRRRRRRSPARRRRRARPSPG